MKAGKRYVGTQNKSCRGDEERQLGGVKMYEWFTWRVGLNGGNNERFQKGINCT